MKTSSASGDRIVATDGGRYDVNLDKRLRYPLYWEEDVSVVRRCSWYYKGDAQSKLVPYKEDMAAKLEVLCLTLNIIFRNTLSVNLILVMGRLQLIRQLLNHFYQDEATANQAV